jgi:catechol 2,3-dioxygenase-like lactoylglutathione lyase family enzyme
LKPVKLDHCVITVSDWERSNRFYRAVLGAEVIPVSNGWAYRFGDEQLNVHGPGQQAIRTPGSRFRLAAATFVLNFRGLSRTRLLISEAMKSKWRSVLLCDPE